MRRYHARGRVVVGDIRFRRMDSVADMDKTILYLIYGGLIYVYLYGITTFRRKFLLNFYGPILR